MDYFISDTHFGHRNVIHFCNRPFRTIEEMNSSIIERWNEIVTDGDRVFVLGDVFLCSPDIGKLCIEKLNGYKVLIEGNHDLGAKKMLWAGFDESHKSYDYKMPDGRLVLLEHHPIPDCMLDEKYDLMLHGHIHLSDRVRGKKINMSCDIWDFKPIPVSVLQNLKLEDTKEDEFVDFNISDDGVIDISGKFEMEDFAGVTKKIFKEMSRLWPNRRKK